METRESLVEARERDLDQREADLLQEVSVRLSEAHRALERKEVSKEKIGLKWKTTLKRSENAKLDVIDVNGRSEKIVLNYLKGNPNPKIPSETMFDAWLRIATATYQKERSKRVRTGIQNVTDELDAGKANSEAMKRGNYIRNKIQIVVWNDNHETMSCLLGLRLRNALLFWNVFGKKGTKGELLRPPLVPTAK